MLYADINEAWGKVADPNPSKSKHDPVCPLVYPEFNDDIMSKYLDTDPGVNKKPVERHLQMSKAPVVEKVKQPIVNQSCFDEENLVGFMGSNHRLLETAYPFDDYYVDNNVRDTEKHKDDVCDEEALPKSSIYKNVKVLEEYANSIAPSQSQSTLTDSQNQLDMILYVVSGVFLIFMMEQVLHLGKLMRR
jgi:hypothetical protein